VVTEIITTARSLEVKQLQLLSNAPIKSIQNKITQTPTPHFAKDNKHHGKTYTTVTKSHLESLGQRDQQWVVVGQVQLQLAQLCKALHPV